jgi:hypothetical protein
MRLQNEPRHQLIAELAHRQHGVVAHRQLIALGLSASAIQRRVRARQLHPLYRGVYAVGHRVLSRDGQWMAAVLACGEGAVLSHRDAAALWAIRQSARPAIDVTAPRSREGHDGITLHKVRRLDPRDCTLVDNVPVTTVPRTLLDLAEVVSVRQLQRAFEQAERLELIDLRAVDELIERSPGRHGVKALKTVIEVLRPLPFTRSDFERDFLELCRELGLPEPAMNVWLAGHEVDCAWHDRRLVVELDSRTWHEARAAMERDRVRDADLLVAGYRTLRITYSRFYRERAAVKRTLEAVYFRKPS